MAETKPRRAGPAAPGGDDCQLDDTEDKERAPKTVAGLLSGSARMWHRWRQDILGVGLYTAMSAFGCGFVTCELLQPADATAVRVLGPLFYAVFALFHASWVGIIYHGPGRPAAAAAVAESRPPPALSAMLTAGKFCKDRPFDASEGPCPKCESWKPVLTHYCKSCGTVGLWMDHHCGLAAQCVGFRNMRCFLLWTFYGEAVAAVCLLLSLHRLLFVGLPDGAWEWALSVAWAADIYGLFWFCREMGAKTLLRQIAGWQSQVLMGMFYALERSAKLVLRDLQDAQKVVEKSSPNDPETVLIDAIVKKLKNAIDGVVRGGGGMVRNMLKGPFAVQDVLQALTLTFGEPPSWRWLVPGVPGGTGDPTRPDKCNQEACAAWAALGSALEQAHPTLVHARSLADQWSRRVQQILGGNAAAEHMEPP